MKNLMFLTFVFIILAVSMTILLSLGIFLIVSSFSMVAGETLAFLGFSTYFYIVILCLPFCLALACLGLVFYFIRHPKTPLLSTVLYFVLGASVWLLAIPVLAPIEVVQNSAFEKFEGKGLSKGFFRENENSVDYITKILPGDGAEALRIVKGKQVDSQLFDESYLNEVKSLFCADPLFDKTIQLTPLLETLQKFYRFARGQVIYSVSKGYLSYLMFASFGLALLSVCFVKALSSWKLINVSIVVSLFVLISKLNRAIFSDKIFDRIVVFFRHNNAFWIANRYNMQFVINLSISFILMSIGLVHFIFVRKKRREIYNENI